MSSRARPLTREPESPLPDARQPSSEGVVHLAARVAAREVIEVALAHEDQRGDDQLPRDRGPRARGRSDAIAPNFLSADDTSEVSDAYSPGVLARLVAVKDFYDQDNVFRINNNIAPSA